MTTAQVSLSDLLAADSLVQRGSVEIRQRAWQIVADASTDREKAVRIFYWQRDDISYCLEADRPALDVLRDGRGVCVTKALLHVALLRAVAVPARMGHVDYESAVLELMFPVEYLQRQPNVYPLHTFAEVLIEGKWITCDATFDVSLDAILAHRE